MTVPCDRQVSNSSAESDESKKSPDSTEYTVPAKLADSPEPIGPRNPSDPFDGLTWTPELCGLKPEWTYEPSIPSIQKTIQTRYPSSTVRVDILGQGLYNKVYEVHVDDEVLIMRVSLPIFSTDKTNSEVATMEWVRRVTDIPLPKVIAFDFSRQNPIGFEWILMTKVPGKELLDLWHHLSMEVKTKLVKQYASFQASLWRNKLEGIGNIHSLMTTTAQDEPKSSFEAGKNPARQHRYHKSHDSYFSFSLKNIGNIDTDCDQQSASKKRIPSATSSAGSSFTEETVLASIASAGTRENVSSAVPETPFVSYPDTRMNHTLQFPKNDPPKAGKIVSVEFFTGGRPLMNVDRGPFLSTQDWLKARIYLAREQALLELKAEKAIVEPDKWTISAIKDIEGKLSLIQKLEDLIPRLFPIPPPSQPNRPEPTVIFHQDMNDSNILLGDNGELMGLIDWECVGAKPLWKACSYPRFLCDHPKTSKPEPEMYRNRDGSEDAERYLQELILFEKTTLRRVFLDEMRVLEPEWAEVFDASCLQRDFDYALEYLDVVLFRRGISKWIAAVERGDENPPGLCPEIFVESLSF